MCFRWSSGILDTSIPEAAWIAQQAGNFNVLSATEVNPLTYIIHDLDTKFTKQFDDILEADGAEIVKVESDAI